MKNQNVKPKKKLPAKPEAFSRWQSKITRKDMMNDIPPFLVLSCWAMINAYYGSPWKTLWHYFKEEIYFIRHRTHIRSILWITDKMGWTKVHHFPESDDWVEHWRRHGGQCSGSPNCSDDDCVSRGIPRWFRKISGYNRLHE